MIASSSAGYEVPIWLLRASERSRFRSIWLYDANDGAKHQVTSDLFDDGSPTFDPKVFAGTIVACALVWTGLIVAALSKRPTAYVEPESTLGLSDDPEVVERLRKGES